jgi:2-keto-4-pentenoate hydratase
MNRVWFIVVLLLVLRVSVTAQMEMVLQPDQVADHIRQRWPINRAIPVTDLDEAYQFQDQVMNLLEPDWGPPAGYKAALTSKAMQARFGADQPVLGVVMQQMLLRDRVLLDEGFAIRPVVEADLMAMVKDESINTAETMEEILAALDGIHPMIEVADLMFVEGATINPFWLTAINAGARFAVVGDPLLVIGSDTNLITRLPDVRATVMDKQGQVLASGTADRLMDHPLNAVRWIRDEVKRRGGSLHAGDVLWLGALTDPFPAQPGESYQVLFTGLQEYPVSIQVNLRRAMPQTP